MRRVKTLVSRTIQLRPIKVFESVLRAHRHLLVRETDTRPDRGDATAAEGGGARAEEGGVSSLVLAPAACQGELRPRFRVTFA